MGTKQLAVSKSKSPKQSADKKSRKLGRPRRDELVTPARVDTADGNPILGGRFVEALRYVLVDEADSNYWFKKAGNSTKTSNTALAIANIDNDDKVEVKLIRNESNTRYLNDNHDVPYYKATSVVRR